MTIYKSRERLLQDVMELAVRDLAFRARLLVDPGRAIYDAFGVRVPPAFRLRFIEKGPDVDALVVLPDLPRSAGELGDDDLEAVAGGTGDPTEGGWW